MLSKSEIASKIFIATMVLSSNIYVIFVYSRLYIYLHMYLFLALISSSYRINPPVPLPHAIAFILNACI